MPRRPNPFAADADFAAFARHRAKIAEHRTRAAAARQQARYDVDAADVAEYHDAEAERLEAELDAVGRGMRGRRPRRNDAEGALTKEVELVGDAREQYLDAVWSMYVKSYSKIGLIVENAEDFLDEYDVWEVSVDENDVPRSFCLYKRTAFGLKIGLSGSDGSPAGRAMARASFSTKFRRPGVYGEVSHRPAELAREAGVPVVCANVAATVLRKDVEQVDAIHYVRNLANVGPVKKMLVGRPLGVPTTDIQQPYCPIERMNPRRRQRPTPDDVADFDAHYASLVGF